MVFRVVGGVEEGKWWKGFELWEIVFWGWEVSWRRRRRCG